MTRVTRFTDRDEAGRLLGAALAGAVPPDVLVLGLPRGGAVVAAEVARGLGAAWDVWLVRKLGHPEQPELAIGALAEDGEPVWEEGSAARTSVDAAAAQRLVQSERAELARRRLAYRGDRPAPDLAGRVVVLVDDGVATGSTARAAIRSLRGAGAAQVVLAVPVASREARRELSVDADRVFVLSTPRDFRSVGTWYDDFRQTTDEEVVALLAAR